MSWLIRSRSDPTNDSRDVWIMFDRPDQRAIVEPLQLRAITEGEATSPTITSSITHDLDGEGFLQAALDHAWEVGLRPKGFRDVPNQVAALRDHLDDMRALVFKDQVKPKGA